MSSILSFLLLLTISATAFHFCWESLSCSLEKIGSSPSILSPSITNRRTPSRCSNKSLIVAMLCVFLSEVAEEYTTSWKIKFPAIIIKMMFKIYPNLSPNGINYEDDSVPLWRTVEVEIPGWRLYRLLKWHRKQCPGRLYPDKRTPEGRYEYSLKLEDSEHLRHCNHK